MFMINYEFNKHITTNTYIYKCCLGDAVHHSRTNKYEQQQSTCTAALGSYKIVVCLHANAHANDAFS